MVNVESGFGLELLERESALILFNQLNDEIDSVQELWADRDKEWQALTGQNPPFTNIEHIQADNFFYGRRPPLVEAAPKELFPNVCCIAQRGEPSASDYLDQGEDHNLSLLVELFVKADEVEAEELVHRRAQRTAEAVNHVMMKNKTLNKVTQGLNSDPSIIVSDIFKRSEENGHGEEFYFQGVQITYNYIRHSKLP